MLLTISLCFPTAVIAQFEEQRLIRLSDIAEAHLAQDFVVYGRACKGRAPVNNTDASCDEYIGEGASDAGIVENVTYRHIPNSQLKSERSLERVPDLETFFDFGGTLELLTTDLTLRKYDLVISELMWGIDKGLRDTEGSITIPNPNYNPNILQDQNNPKTITITVPEIRNQETQWIELYNTTDTEITAELYFLFMPFRSHPVRENDTVKIDGISYRVLDAVDTLFNGLWRLPGKSGKRPTTAFVSAYRNIDYQTVEDTNFTRRTQLSGIPFGFDPDGWERTPDRGRRNTELRVVTEGSIVEIPCIATPGTKHVPSMFFERLDRLPVRANTVVINEVRNDTSTENVDWIELKNISNGIVQLENWELSIVTGVGEDNDLVDLPEYELNPGEILLLVNEDPWFTPIIGGINIIGEKAHFLEESSRSYFVDTRLNLPNTGRFVILLRSESDQNRRDRAIQDYAGNGFFVDTSSHFSTGFWPRVGQLIPTDVADFGENTFASPNNTWARIRYQRNDGHHKDAWEVVEAKGGLGYDPGAELLNSPGTPGYDNNAVKTQLENKLSPKPDAEYDDGEISISEIMYDPGANRNRVQWIELYNSSMTQAINLKGWELEIRNLLDEEGRYVRGSFEFDDAVILPNQTLLLVSEKAGTDVPSNRVYDLYRRHRRELRLTRRSDLLLSPTAFYLKLTDTVDPELQGDDVVVDEVGNFDVVGDKRDKLWELPPVSPERRRSVVRLYGGLFKPDKVGLDGKPSPPDDGMKAEGWRRFSAKGLSMSFYGARDDLASPGYRMGGPLPVALSSFRPVRLETGEVLIKWRTESELENAGFNILRSECRAGDFTVVNIKGIIPGHGTSSEHHDYQWTDTMAKPNVIYYYRIEDVSFDGVRQTLATVRLKGHVSAKGKVFQKWGDMKTHG